MFALLNTSVSTNEWLLILVIALVCILAFVIFDYFRATKEKEREMAQMQERLDHANKERDEAVALARAKETAATGISNEILNPINAIRTVVGLVADEDITDEIREYCEVLKISADSLAHTANEVLGYEEEDIDETNVRSEIDEKKLVIPDARILLVDDNKVSLRVAKALINLFKPEIVSADNAYEAIDRIRNGEKFDLIFMDHLMPGMDGIEATKHIHELEGDGSRTPIVALTANTAGNLEQTFFNAGMCDFLAKPIVVKQLNAILKKWITKDKQIYVDASEALTDYMQDNYRPERAIKDYWNDFPLFKEVLILFKEQGDLVFSKLMEGEDENLEEEITKLSRYTRSIRALKLEDMMYDLVEAYSSPDKEGYAEIVDKASKEYGRVCEIIKTFIDSRSDDRDKENATDTLTN